MGPRCPAIRLCYVQCVICYVQYSRLVCLYRYILFGQSVVTPPSPSLLPPSPFILSLPPLPDGVYGSVPQPVLDEEDWIIKRALETSSDLVSSHPLAQLSSVAQNSYAALKSDSVRHQVQNCVTTPTSGSTVCTMHYSVGCTFLVFLFLWMLHF